MTFSSKLIAGAMTLIIGIPFAAAHTFVAQANTTAATPPSFYDSEIPDGRLTIGEFIDAVSSRLYNTDIQDACFADLVGVQAASYSLLFNDVSINQPIALSVCAMMKNGLVRGSSNMLHPNKLLTAAEAATVFARLSVSVRNPRTNEAWYERYMESMRSLDSHFTFQPGDIITGVELRDMLCMLKRTTPQLDPMGEFRSC